MATFCRRCAAASVGVGCEQVGLQLCVLGMVKKMAIADHMALFADPAFADPGAFRTSALWFATLAYMIQVYCDFSGYSDLAIGTAHLLGYRLAWNFNFPYLAANVGEFWRRWHISLGNWLRDYLFLPLGGSRASEARIFANYLLVMSLCGLWHGAAWPFVMFGTVHGVWLGVHRLVRNSFNAVRLWIRSCSRRPARLYGAGCFSSVF